ncbi:MAG: hypothetical protein NC489_22930 [Ruminococcus flavefaciens]|nr:hypothetical protein [Ruminococcus flavefaciens]
MDNVTLAIAKSYVDESLQGVGALVGKNVQVSKIEPIIGGNKVTFTYTLDNGTQQNSYLEVMNGENGASVVSSSIDKEGNLSFELSNGEKISAGKISIEIDGNSIDLENYYTKGQTDEKFVSLLDLDNLIEKKFNEHFIAVTSEEIKNLFKSEE